jgi:hypothetical protein
VKEDAVTIAVERSARERVLDFRPQGTRPKPQPYGVEWDAFERPIELGTGRASSKLVTKGQQIGRKWLVRQLFEAALDRAVM